MEKTLASLLLPLRAQLGLLARTTPTNLNAEMARLVPLAERGVFCPPAFQYAAASDHDGSIVRDGIARIAEALPREDEALRRRVDELLLEAELGNAVGTARFGALADARFHCADSAMRAALRLANEWVRLSATEVAETIRTDSGEPGSLLSQMAAAVRAHSPYHRVVTRSGMTALAATGDEYVYVACDRWLSAESGRRVVVHEVLGHVAPRVRAVANVDERGRLGTFRGEDTQEGYAIFCEARANALHEHRKRELAERHLACVWMGEHATFAEVVKTLMRDHGTGAEQAVRIAIRAFRGSGGTGKGLGRERVYLPYYVLVKEHLKAFPDDEPRLTSGQRSLDELAPPNCL